MKAFGLAYQVPAWIELESIELVALYDRTSSKAETLAHQFSVPMYITMCKDLLNYEKLDFVDIITDVDTCAPKLPLAQQMFDVFSTHQIPFLIHENWRWQAPIRKVKELLDSNVIGKVFKSQVTFCSGFPAFENQPILDEFILTDIGAHILDV